MRFSSRATAVVATVPLALGLAACGGEAPQSAGELSPVTSTTPSVVTTTAAPQKAAAPAVARLDRATFVPAMNNALARQTSWKMTGTVTAGGQVLMTISGVQRTKPLAMSISMSGEAFDGRTGKVVLIGKNLYLSIPGATPAGKYFRADPSDPSMAEFNELVDSADPTKTFKAFEGALRDVKFVRSETIGGVKLDRYAVTVDARKALKAQGQKVPAGVPSTITYSMWMDAGKMARRFSFELKGVGMVMTLDPVKGPVTIKAPAAKNVLN